MIIAAIIALLLIGGPLAVGRFVIAIVVFALDRVLLRGPSPHIQEEALKSRNSAFSKSPSLAHRDSSPHVAFFLVGPFVRTATFDGAPVRVFRKISKRWLEIIRQHNNVIPGFRHSSICLTSSEGRSATTDGLCAFNFSYSAKGVKP